MKPTRQELLSALRAVHQYVGSADVLFEPCGQDDGEWERVRLANEALTLVQTTLMKEAKL